MQAGIYGQVVRWFQNHSYSDKKSCKKSARTKSLSHDENQSSDDEEAVEAHLSELAKEMKKKQHNKDKVARLLSLTFSNCRAEMLSQPANSRISTALQKYPCLGSPMYVSNLSCEVHNY